MHEPAAPLRFSVVAFAAVFLSLSGCERSAESTPPPQAAARPEPPTVIAPAPPPVLSRGQLLAAMDDAAAAYAAGQTPAEQSPVGASSEADPLVGRRFTLRQSFGCSAPLPPGGEPPDALAHWAWKDDGQAIELTLKPGDWAGTALLAGAAADWEAVEGHWLARPWLRADGCPGVRPDPLSSGQPAPSPQTMGLAAVFETGGSRLGQRNGRAYSFTVRGKGAQPVAAPEGGYRLVMEGRLVAFAEGRAVQCRAASPDQRPVCIAAARLDRVAFEDASGALLSEWTTR